MRSQLCCQLKQMFELPEQLIRLNNNSIISMEPNAVEIEHSKQRK